MSVTIEEKINNFIMCETPFVLVVKDQYRRSTYAEAFAQIPMAKASFQSITQALNKKPPPNRGAIVIEYQSHEHERITKLIELYHRQANSKGAWVVVLDVMYPDDLPKANELNYHRLTQGAITVKTIQDFSDSVKALQSISSQTLNSVINAKQEIIKNGTAYNILLDYYRVHNHDRYHELLQKHSPMKLNAIHILNKAKVLIGSNNKESIEAGAALCQKLLTSGRFSYEASIALSEYHLKKHNRRTAYTLLYRAHRVLGHELQTFTPLMLVSATEKDTTMAVRVLNRFLLTQRGCGVDHTISALYSLVDSPNYRWLGQTLSNVFSRHKRTMDNYRDRTLLEAGINAIHAIGLLNAGKPFKAHLAYLACKLPLSQVDTTVGQTICALKHLYLHRSGIINEIENLPELNAAKIIDNIYQDVEASKKAFDDALLWMEISVESGEKSLLHRRYPLSQAIHTTNGEDGHSYRYLRRVYKRTKNSQMHHAIHNVLYPNGEVPKKEFKPQKKARSLTRWLKSSEI